MSHTLANELEGISLLRRLPSIPMKTGQTSITAELAAVARARHLKYDKPVIFDDPYAIRLVKPFFRQVLNQPILSHIFFNLVFRSFRPIEATVLARSRFVEDHLLRLNSKGLNQYVLLGAGLDSFILRKRRYTPELRVYEVDYPSSQRNKCESLSRLPEWSTSSDNVEFIPIDFETESLEICLARSTFCTSEPALFAWLGVVPYLTASTIEATLHAVALCASPGSEIIFDYIPYEHHSSKAALSGASLFLWLADILGEQVQTGIHPMKLNNILEKTGFQLLEQLDPEEMYSSYFTSSGSRLRPTKFLSLVRCRII